MKLRELFLHAVNDGDIGMIDDSGVVITLKDLETRFPEIDARYFHHFLPASTLLNADQTISSEKFLIKIDADTYRVHPQFFETDESLVNIH